MLTRTPEGRTLAMVHDRVQIPYGVPLTVLFPDGPEDSCDLELKWEPLENARASRVAIYLDPADPADRANWPTYRAWAVETLGKLRQAFSAPINELQKTN